MVKTVTMPSSPNFRRSTFTLNRAIGATRSPFTGKTRTQEFDFAAWSADVTYESRHSFSLAIVSIRAERHSEYVFV